MRLKNLILCLLLCIASASAKDVITKTDGTKLDAKVEEITETLIKYRKASNPTGPIYTIPLESVASITYENGEVDVFSSPTAIHPLETLGSPSDDDLIRMTGDQDLSYSGFVSDAQLLNMANSKTPFDLLNRKAKNYRLIGWIGGSLLVAAGGIIGIVLFQDQYDINNDYDLPVLIAVGSGLIAGTGWCLGFNLKANSIMKQARAMQPYSATIFENEFFQFGNNTLTAGINIMGNRMVNSHSLGLSFGLNF